jgi:hypothetical protein
MMGHRQVEQAALFYEFSLDKHIPADHLLRSNRLQFTAGVFQQNPPEAHIRLNVCFVPKAWANTGHSGPRIETSALGQ